MNEKIRQISQIRKSDTYDDALPVGETLETGAEHIEDDLNALRSQVRRLGRTDNWYDTPEPPVVPISGTPPPDPDPGQLWFDDESGNTFIWYDDGDSQQWVITIQVTDGVNLVPVEDNSVYAGGPKTFDLSDTPYDGYVAVFVNGVRIDKTDWSLAGLTLTILGTLEAGDEVTLDFFTSSEGSGGCVDPYALALTQYNDLDMDNDGTQPASFTGNPALVFDTLAWTNLNSFADVEQDA